MNDAAVAVVVDDGAEGYCGEEKRSCRAKCCFVEGQEWRREVREVVG